MIYTKVHSLHRSGIHCIVNWLESLFPTSLCYNIWDEVLGLDIKKIENILKQYIRISPNFFSLIFEDFDLRMEIENLKVMEYISTLVPEAECINIIILRDFFNLMASRTKSFLDSGSPTPSGFLLEYSHFHIIWKQYAQEYINETEYLPNKLVISYNHWVKDQDYRKKICSRLGGQYNERTLDNVPATNGGSSFDFLEYDGCANKMNIFGRYRYLQNHPIVQISRGLIDGKILRLNHEIFGDILNTEQMLEELFDV